MALGLSKDEIKNKLFGRFTEKTKYLSPLPTEEYNRIADIIANVMAENNNKILTQLAMADVNIDDI